MAEAPSKIYYIQYYTDKTIVNPANSQTYYKVKLVSYQVGGSPVGKTINEDQYNRWISGLTPFHYINDTHFTIDSSYVDTDSKNQSIADSDAIKIQFDVYNNWDLYLKFDSVGNLERANDFKTLARANANSLNVDGQKSFIIEQMRYLKGKIDVLTDLYQDTTDLDEEYNDLISEYEAFLTT